MIYNNVVVHLKFLLLVLNMVERLDSSIQEHDIEEDILGHFFREKYVYSSSKEAP